MAEISGVFEPTAEVKRVYYEGTSTIYEGMPVAYNYDTTDNWLGWGEATLAASPTEQGTTADGEQNEGKYIRVEDVTADNHIFLAGFVAGSANHGKTGPRILDIYVPNGAIIPVWTDKSIAARDKLYLEDGEATVVNAVQLGMLGCVGTAVETVDRSSTAGLVLAKVKMPNDSQIVDGTLGIAPSELLWKDCPWKEIEGNPGLGVTYFDDFTGPIDVTTGDGFTLTLVDTKGSVSREAGAPGGILQVTSATGDSADDGIQAQLTNCAVLPAAVNTIWFEARVKVSDATQQWYCGLAAVDTTLIAAGAIDDASDKCGFFHHAASTDNKVSSITARTSADDATADVAAVVDDTWMTIGFRITGLATVEFYVNGVLVETGATAANIPNAAMCLSFVSQYESADNILSVDWVKLAALGGRDA